MDYTQKLLKTIINHQSSVKEELLKEIKNLKNILINRIDNLESTTNKGFKDINRRVDIIGKQLAYLEDDAPTREEFDELVEKVNKIQANFAV